MRTLTHSSRAFLSAGSCLSLSGRGIFRSIGNGRILVCSVRCWTCGNCGEVLPSPAFAEPRHPLQCFSGGRSAFTGEDLRDFSIPSRNDSTDRKIRDSPRAHTRGRRAGTTRRAAQGHLVKSREAEKSCYPWCLGAFVVSASFPGSRDSYSLLTGTT
jgi:hypothetical protein